MAISACVWIVVCWKSSLKASEDRRINNFCVRLFAVIKVVVNARAPRNNWLQQFKTALVQTGFPAHPLPRAQVG